MFSVLFSLFIFIISDIWWKFWSRMKEDEMNFDVNSAVMWPFITIFTFRPIIAES